MSREALKVAVSGGTSGIGRAIVRCLSNIGAEIAFIGRDPLRVRLVEQECSGSIGFVGDVSNVAAVSAFADVIIEKLGRLDAVINGAAILGPIPPPTLSDIEPQDWKQAMEINLTGPLLLTKHTLPMLLNSVGKGRRPVVINISSDAAIRPYAGWGAYCVSKAALLQLTNVWREELMGSGIELISFNPGDVDTPMYATSRSAAPLAAVSAQAIENAAVINNPQVVRSPEEVALEIISLITTSDGEK